MGTREEKAIVEVGMDHKAKKMPTVDDAIMLATATKTLLLPETISRKWSAKRLQDNQWEKTK
jgi:hypothetical protein